MAAKGPEEWREMKTKLTKLSDAVAFRELQAQVAKLDEAVNESLNRSSRGRIRRSADQGPFLKH